MRKAIVRSGIAGLGAALQLNHQQQETLYERNDCYGGHSNARLIETEAHSN
jgi:predicted NAD/FAD-binding protein